MKIITGLSEQPKQQSTLVLADGTRAVWSLSYVSQQTGWFYDLSWNGTVVATGQRMVSSPNILRQYINKISFGIAVVSPNQLEPTTQTALVDGTVTCYLLEGADLQAIETTIFNAPAGQVQPVGSTTAGLPVVVLPANWGPAGGDLAYAYPNPQVVAMHDGTGQRLAFGTVEDGKFLKRVGETVIGATVAPGTGNVSGPASSTIGNVALWADVAGTELSDGGTLGTAAFANSSSFLGATASASGDLSGNYPSPKVAAITTGSTQLTIGAIADGEFLVRSGSTLIGSVPSGAGDVFGPSSTVTVGTVALFATTDGKNLGPSAITLGTIASQAASNVTITGGSIAGAAITAGSGGTINGVPINGSTIGAITAASGRFSSVTSTGSISAATTITATGNIGAANFSGSSSGTNTGDQTTITGNAGTATALANARTIGGSSFNGTANVTSFPSPGPIGGTTPSTAVFTTLHQGPAGAQGLAVGFSGIAGQGFTLRDTTNSRTYFITTETATGLQINSGANPITLVGNTNVSGALSATGQFTSTSSNGIFQNVSASDAFFRQSSVGGSGTDWYLTSRTTGDWTLTNATYANIYRVTNTYHDFFTLNTLRARIDSTGIAITGALSSTGNILGSGTYVGISNPTYPLTQSNGIGAAFSSLAGADIYGVDFRRWTGTATQHSVAYIGQYPNAVGGYSIGIYYDAAKTTNTQATTRIVSIDQLGVEITGALNATSNLNLTGIGADLTGLFATAGGAGFRFGLFRYDAIGGGSALISANANVGIMAGATGSSTSGNLVGNFSTSGLAITGALDVTSTIGLIRLNSSADLDTTGYGYISYRDNSTGSYTERAYVGFGAGNGNFNLYSSAPGKAMTLGVDGVTNVLTLTSTGLGVIGGITATADIAVSGATALAYRLTRGAVQGIWQNGLTVSYFGTASAHNTEIVVNNLVIGAFSSTGLAVSGDISSAGIISSTSSNQFPLRLTGATTGATAIQFLNTGGGSYFGAEGNSTTNLIVGCNAYDTIIRGSSGIAFSANAGNNMQMRLSSAGLAVTGTINGVTLTAGTGTPALTVNGAASISGANTGDQTLAGLGGQPASATLNALATGSEFVRFSGPTTLVKEFTLPNADATILTSNAAVTAAQGGTGLTSYTTGDLIYAFNSTTLAKLALGGAGQVLKVNTAGNALEYGSVSGSGTVTGVSVVDANGFNGTVATPTADAAITLKTTVNGILKGNSTSGAVSAAVAGTDYVIPSGSITGNAANVTGVVAVGNGGTGQSTYTDGQILIGNTSTGGLSKSTLTAGSNITITNAAGAITIASTGGGGIAIPTAAGNKYARLGRNTASALTSTTDLTWYGPDVFNVQDYGALGNDSNDDTSAIAAALLAACSSSRGATVYLPQGTYKISDTLTGSFGVNDQMYGLTITGDGIGTTIIKQYGTNKGVFHLTNTAVAGCLTLKDFSCWNQSGVMSTLQCIRYEVSQIANDDAHTNLQVSNLSITPPFGAGTWAIGLDLYRVHNGSILNYQYAGNNAGGGTGIVFQQSGSGDPSGAKKSMACFIQGCQMNLCNTGVRIKDAMETCLIQECVMVGLVYGVYADYCIHLGVSNSHINVNPAGVTGVACIFSSGTGGDVDQSIIVGNLLYSQGYANLVGIKGGFVRSSFSGNSFIALGGQTGTRGISVTGKGLSITGNSFYQHTDSYITSSATYSIISSNTATIDPGAVATTPYSITGTGTTAVNNIYEP